MKFLRGCILAVGVLLCASFIQVRGKTPLLPQNAAQSNSDASLVRAESDPQARSSSAIANVNITFTTITVPEAAYTSLWDINKFGVIVGNFGQNPNCDCDSHGFYYNKGTFTYFDYPGQDVTMPTGINDSGIIAGNAGNSFVVGFLYNGTTFTTLRDGTNSATRPWGINNASSVVGGAGSIYATRGFELRGRTYKPLSPPGTYIYIYATGINNFGQIVGWTASRRGQRRRPT